MFEHSSTENSQELNLKTLDYVNFVKENIDYFQYEANLKKIQLTFISQIEYIELNFDKRKIRSVLFNLISNSIKYSESNSVVKVKIEKRKNNDKNFILTTVADQGKGIALEDQSKIFQRFNQVEKHRVDSVGIGLNISQSYVLQHGGEIDVESELSKGTSFSFRLPLESISDRNTSSISNSEIDRVDFENLLKDDNIDLVDCKHIVVVEDDLQLLNYISEKLSNFFKVTTFSNGTKALEMIEVLKPDLVITDLKMPEMNGDKLCKALKLNLNTNHIPVIILTSQIDVKYEIKSLFSGADSFVKKPFDFELLVAKIYSLINTYEKLETTFRKDIYLKPSEINITNPDEKFLQQLYQIVDENIGNSDFDINQLSQEMGYSRTIFFDKMKTILGQTPGEFIKSMRLKAAIKILSQIENDYTISEVAFMVGFKDPKYFSKIFKSETGVSPKSYFNYITKV
jgi:CheY-like chemotaxis protein